MTDIHGETASLKGDAVFFDTRLEVMNTKVSLCVIAGNAERYIERFIGCFSLVADEINIISATGCAKDDNTKKIASNLGANVMTYDNELGRRSWRHVDNFAAARNAAYGMAGEEFGWVMWADTDDVISSEDASALRAFLASLPDDIDCVMMPYSVPEDGLVVMRERLTRRGIGTWKGKVHEHLFLPETCKAVEFKGGMILHKPDGSRARNDERNLRILESIPHNEKTIGEKFHQFQSMRAVGRLEEAGLYAVNILTDHSKDLGKPEKFELFIACGQLAGDPATRSQMMLQALGTDPGRREAYGELALCMIAAEDNEAALSLTERMLSIPEPEEYLWNARRKYYGWQGVQLHGMALRRNGRYHEADAIQRNHFIRHGAKISLIHATRGRIKMALDCMREWYNKAENPDAIEHIYALDADDEQAPFLSVYNHVGLPDGTGGPVAAWNLAARKSCGEILVQLSDDWTPPLHWDRMILDAMAEADGEAVLAVSDGHRKDDLLCMAIMNRARYEKQGYMFHPEFFSMYSDNWFSYRAFFDGVVIDARDKICFEHKHPAHKTGEMDAIYARSNAPERYAHGEAVFRKLVETETP